MIKEFKKFIMRGNMIDLAVGVIIGGAFNSIVSSLVNDVFMPIISLFTGRIDFSNLFITLNGEKYDTLAQAQAAGAATIKYGQFISNVINFLIMAIVVFFIVKFINKINFISEPPKKITTRVCPYCKSTISIDATRCPNCTSELEIEVNEDGEN